MQLATTSTDHEDVRPDPALRLDLAELLVDSVEGCGLVGRMLLQRAEHPGSLVPIFERTHLLGQVG